MTEISKEYGAALFELACETGNKDAYAEALGKIKSAFLAEPSYLEFLSSPSIPMSERLSAIEEAFLAVLPEDVLSFLQLLCEKGRIFCFMEAEEEYQKLLAASMRVAEAKVTSAAELTREELDALRQKLEKMTGCAVNIECKTDPALLGGMMVEIDGKVMDGSLRGRLREIKDVINR